MGDYTFKDSDGRVRVRQRIDTSPCMLRGAAVVLRMRGVRVNRWRVRRVAELATSFADEGRGLPLALRWASRYVRPGARWLR